MCMRKNKAIYSLFKVLDDKVQALQKINVCRASF